MHYVEYIGVCPECTPLSKGGGGGARAGCFNLGAEGLITMQCEAEPGRRWLAALSERHRKTGKPPCPVRAVTAVTRQGEKTVVC